MGRSPCCEKVGLKKGPWTPEEDQKLLSFIQEHGHGSWRALPPKAGLQRCGKSCRLRWTNYLRPDIKRGKFSLQEEQTIIQLHALLGNRWSTIASHLPKRTDNEIKNYWNTHLKKRLVKMGIDPTTHKPKNHALGCSQPKDIANLSHMAQWESARLEAEARIVRESKLVSFNNSQIMNKTTAAAASAHPPPTRPPCLDILKVWQGTWTKTSRKDLIANTFLSGNGSLESPTSILNFSDNVIAAAPVVGLIHESLNNYVANPSHDEHDKGIMENNTMQMQLHDHHHHQQQHHHHMTITDTNASAYVVSESLKFPSFLDGGFTDLPPSAAGTADAALFEDSKMNYWSNILSVVNSPMDSPVF